MAQKRITVDLGPLAEPLAEYCERHGVRASDAVRKAVAKLLRIKAPEMRGHLANLRQYQDRDHSGGSTTSDT